jgi:hypothetical protein
MNKILKNTDAKITKSFLEKEKIQIGGKLGVDLKATFPGSVEGQGDAKFFFSLPTWLTFDIVRRIGEYIKSKQNIE